MNEMVELIRDGLSWKLILGSAAIFGFFPGFCLRQIVRMYPKGDPRRCALIGDLYELARFKRWFFVFEQLETVLADGVPARLGNLRYRLKEWRRGRADPGLLGVVKAWNEIEVLTCDPSPVEMLSPLEIEIFNHLRTTRNRLVHGQEKMSVEQRRVYVKAARLTIRSLESIRDTHKEGEF